MSSLADPAEAARHVESVRADDDMRHFAANSDGVHALTLIARDLVDDAAEIRRLLMHAAERGNILIKSRVFKYLA